MAPLIRAATHSHAWALTWTILFQVVKAFPSESFHLSSLSIPLYLLFSIYSLYICIFFYLYSTLPPTRASSLPAAWDCRVKLHVSCLRCAADVLCLCILSAVQWPLDYRLRKATKNHVELFRELHSIGINPSEGFISIAETYFYIKEQ